MLDLPEEGEAVKGLGTTPAAVRGVVRMVEINTTPPGLEGVRETFEIRPQVTVTLLHHSGKVAVIRGEDEATLVRFLKDHREAFLQYLDAHSAPVYDFNYDHLADVFDRVFRNRHLPGRPTTGLFETQRHVTAAAYAALMQRKGIIIVGEMGIGKSAIGAALAGALHARGHLKPGEVAVVICPPHLTRKWVREVEDAIPGCVVAIAETVDDVAAFMRRAADDPHTLHVLVASRERMKLGEGWEPAYVVRQEHVAQWPAGSPPPPRLHGKPRIITHKHLCCPTCGLPIPTKKDGSGTASLAWLKQQPRTCHRCGAPLWQLKRRWSGPAPGEKFPRRNPRYPLARFLRQRYPDRVGVVLCDEWHELKGGSSDQERAMQDLVLIARKAVGLTGTLFGGTSSSVFWLEWAINPRMVTQYPLTDGRAAAIQRWVRATGVMERVVEYKEDRAGSGAYSGIRRIEHAPREAPGISPRLVAELVDHCLWVDLKDLNFALPDYQDIPVEVSLPPDVQAEYERAKRRMLDYLVALRSEGDASFLSTYLQAALRYPSACFRPKPVVHRLKERGADGERIERHVVTLKGFGEERVYPEEEELCRLVERELAGGRRCAVFVAQTGTLDIQPRLERLIKERVPGAQPFILRQNTTQTDRRDAYLKRRVQAGDSVLIANPRLLMTGLDLIDFPTLIFAECDYSLYVMSQAARRAWRIGQTQACRTYYLYYSATMEAQAIDLISRKQAAAALLGGDADGGGLAQLAGGSNSLLAELARVVAEDERVVDAAQLFRQQAEASLDFTSGWAASVAAAQPSQPEPVETPPAPEPQAPQPAPGTASPPVEELPAQVTPLYRQYADIKRQFPHALVFFRLGGRYECFDEDADILARELDIVLTSRNVGAGRRVRMAGVPCHSAEHYLARLVMKGHHVAIAEQVGDQPVAGVMPRQVVRVVTSPAQPAGGNGRAKEGVQPGAALIGRRFVDPQGRTLTVTGLDPLFPDTHVWIEREGRTYGILV